jgi:hypothetical protein
VARIIGKKPVGRDRFDCASSARSIRRAGPAVKSVRGQVRGYSP